MNSSLPQEYIQLLRKMRMMMVKIENFNQTGVMEGARAVQVHNFTSMKQDVLDLCDSRYDAKIKKCCAEQSIENFDELQVRMKALIAKMKCYNKCVKMAISEMTTTPRKGANHGCEMSPQANNQVLIKSPPGDKKRRGDTADPYCQQYQRTRFKHTRHNTFSSMATSTISPKYQKQAMLGKELPLPTITFTPPSHTKQREDECTQHRGSKNTSKLISVRDSRHSRQATMCDVYIRSARHPDQTFHHDSPTHNGHPKHSRIPNYEYITAKQATPERTPDSGHSMQRRSPLSQSLGSGFHVKKNNYGAHRGWHTSKDICGISSADHSTSDYTEDTCTEITGDKGDRFEVSSLDTTHDDTVTCSSLTSYEQGTIVDYETSDVNSAIMSEDYTVKSMNFDLSEINFSSSELQTDSRVQSSKNVESDTDMEEPLLPVGLDSERGVCARYRDQRKYTRYQHTRPEMISEYEDDSLSEFSTVARCSGSLKGMPIHKKVPEQSSKARNEHFMPVKSVACNALSVPSLTVRHRDHDLECSTYKQYQHMADCTNSDSTTCSPGYCPTPQRFPKARDQIRKSVIEREFTSEIPEKPVKKVCDPRREKFIYPKLVKFDAQPILDRRLRDSEYTLSIGQVHGGPEGIDSSRLHWKSDVLCHNISNENRRSSTTGHLLSVDEGDEPSSQEQGHTNYHSKYKQRHTSSFEGGCGDDIPKQSRLQPNPSHEPYSTAQRKEWEEEYESEHLKTKVKLDQERKDVEFKRKTSRDRTYEAHSMTKYSNTGTNVINSSDTSAKAQSYNTASNQHTACPSKNEPLSQSSDRASRNAYSCLYRSRKESSIQYADHASRKESSTDHASKNEHSSHTDYESKNEPSSHTDHALRNESSSQYADLASKNINEPFSCDDRTKSSSQYTDHALNNESSSRCADLASKSKPFSCDDHIKSSTQYTDLASRNESFSQYTDCTSRNEPSSQYADVASKNKPFSCDDRTKSSSQYADCASRNESSSQYADLASKNKPFSCDDRTKSSSQYADCASRNESSSQYASRNKSADHASKNKSSADHASRNKSSSQYADHASRNESSSMYADHASRNKSSSQYADHASRNKSSSQYADHASRNESSSKYSDRKPYSQNADCALKNESSSHYVDPPSHADHASRNEPSSQSADCASRNESSSHYADRVSRNESSSQYADHALRNKSSSKYADRTSKNESSSQNADRASRNESSSHYTAKNEPPSHADPASRNESSSQNADRASRNEFSSHCVAKNEPPSHADPASRNEPSSQSADRASSDYASKNTFSSQYADHTSRNKSSSQYADHATRNKSSNKYTLKNDPSGQNVDCTSRNESSSHYVVKNEPPSHADCAFRNDHHADHASKNEPSGHVDRALRNESSDHASRNLYSSLYADRTPSSQYADRASKNEPSSQSADYASRNESSSHVVHASKNESSSQYTDRASRQSSQYAHHAPKNKLSNQSTDHASKNESSSQYTSKNKPFHCADHPSNKSSSQYADCASRNAYSSLYADRALRKESSCQYADHASKNDPSSHADHAESSIQYAHPASRNESSSRYSDHVQRKEPSSHANCALRNESSNKSSRNSQSADYASRNKPSSPDHISTEHKSRSSSTKPVPTIKSSRTTCENSAIKGAQPVKIIKHGTVSDKPRKEKNWKVKFHRSFLKGLTFNMKFPKFAYR